MKPAVRPTVAIVKRKFAMTLVPEFHVVVLDGQVNIFVAVFVVVSSFLADMENASDLCAMVLGSTSAGMA